MSKIIDFLKTLYHEHFALIVVSIVLFAILIITAIILGRIHTNKRKKKKFEENKKKAVTNLTPQEIDNISKNVADKNDLYTYLSTPENEEKDKKSKKSSNKKQPTTKTSDEPKKEEPKVEDAPAKEPTATKPTTKTAPKATPAKPTPSKNTVVTQKPQKKQAYLGKWKIKDEDGKFYAELVASNGSLLLKTEKYTSLSGVKNGIETIKKNIENGNVVISLDKHGHYHFKLYSNTNRLICISEDYSSKAKCESGIESVKRFAQTPTIIREESTTEK